MITTLEKCITSLSLSLFSLTVFHPLSLEHTSIIFQVDWILTSDYYLLLLFPLLIALCVHTCVHKCVILNYRTAKTTTTGKLCWLPLSLFVLFYQPLSSSSCQVSSRVNCMLSRIICTLQSFSAVTTLKPKRQASHNCCCSAGDGANQCVVLQCGWMESVVRKEKRLHKDSTHRATFDKWHQAFCPCYAPLFSFHYYYYYYCNWVSSSQSNWPLWIVIHRHHHYQQH